MQIQVNNFRGIKTAIFTVAQIVLIGAKNAAGKSSIAQAVGALLTGNPVPDRAVSKNTAGQLVHAGTAAGRAMVKDADGSTDIQWPRALCVTEGAPPTASDYAAGLSCVLALTAKDRAKALAEYLDAEPTREDLVDGLSAVGLPVEQIDRLWEMILAGGWDGAHEQVKAKGAQLKGQWEQITGQNFGSKKAEDYTPEGWEPSLDGASGDALEAAVVDAREVLEAAIAVDAVDEDRRGELAEKAATVPELLTAKNDATTARGETKKAVDDARAAVMALPLIDTGKTAKCPHCEKPVEVIGGEVVKAEPLTKAETDKRKKAHAEAAAILSAAQNEDEKVTTALADISANLTAAQRAASELDKMPPATTASGANIDAARGVLRDAEERLDAWKKKTTADKRAESIAINVQIVAALKPDGVRQKKLAAAMATASAEIAAVTSAATEWGTVAFDGDMEASLNGTPYGLLSKSERYRVRVAIQLWQAIKDKSAAVVVDGADVLVDKALRNGLFRVLSDMPIPAVVTMAMIEREAMPDISAAGVGTSYWIEAGELKPL